MFLSKKFTKRNFSLIELLIVIGIMGALAALILPSFSDTEDATKDTACDYNQAGTLRYLTMFHAANGVYPAGFHTGLDSLTATEPLNVDGGTETGLTVCAEYNFGTASDIGALTDEMKQSLDAAGIVSLAAGYDEAERIATTTTVASVKADTTGKGSWTETLDAMTGEIDTANAEPLCVQGVALGLIAEQGISTTAPTKFEKFRKVELVDDTPTYKWAEETFKIVPLYVAPTIDWTTYYKDGANDSKVSIAMAGKCPWGSGEGKARYYIAFFKVYNNTTGDIPAAKLLATSCPDCGILDADLF